jgi:hypothetical protein
MLRAWSIGFVLAAAACGGGSAQPVAAVPAAGSGGSTGSATAGCDSARAKVEGLYRAEAQTREPTRAEEATADNTAMVMTDCAKAPATVVACIGGVATVAALEKQCLAPLDAEGTEGEMAR